MVHERGFTPKENRQNFDSTMKYWEQYIEEYHEDEIVDDELERDRRRKLEIEQKRQEGSFKIFSHTTKDKLRAPE